jgi:excisionase family DNA binding protein
MFDKLLTIDDVAKVFSVEPSVVRYWMRTTNIPYVKIGKQIRFDPGDIKVWVEQFKTGQSKRWREPLEKLT